MAATEPQRREGFLNRLGLHVSAVHLPEASVERNGRLGPACFHERDTFSETRDVRRRVDVERRERPLLTASTNADLEPSAAELIERAQALREMHGVVERRDIHRAAEPDALSTRGCKSHRLRRPELRESAEHLLLGPRALETERLGTAEERAKRLRVKRAVGKTLRHGDRNPHAKDARSRAVAHSQRS